MLRVPPAAGLPLLDGVVSSFAVLEGAGVTKVRAAGGSGVVGGSFSGPAAGVCGSAAVPAAVEEGVTAAKALVEAGGVDPESWVASAADDAGEVAETGVGSEAGGGVYFTGDG